MKNFKAIFLSMFFVIGLMSMSDTNQSSSESANVEVKPVDCATVFTVCNNGFPDDYVLFNAWKIMAVLDNNFKTTSVEKVFV